ncbi:hypothetical protein KPL78_02940 [Roseomonas sp. HJA6]|uniref:AAA domain-containing protein n=1 Tax=Roseomonas alba TaxID=2846776 RepID=A0ABS7A3D0_9PROT|nr:hypothetical protein [Neoroseomonas alba]MBW6396783.1 hypothetical protein [Neoroseomonas alba]
MKPPSLRPELARAAATLARVAEEGGLRALTLVGAVRGEGVTTITAHLARELVDHLGLRVLLVDLAPGKRRLAQTLGRLSTAPATIREDAVAGAASPWALVDLAQAAEPLRDLRQRLSALLGAAAGRFDIVLVDAPPLADGLEALAAARVCGQALLVIRAGNLPYEVLERMRDDLVEAKVDILGVILNQRREVVPAWIDRLLR